MIVNKVNQALRRVRYLFSKKDYRFIGIDEDGMFLELCSKTSIVRSTKPMRCVQNKDYLAYIVDNTFLIYKGGATGKFLSPSFQGFWLLLDGKRQYLKRDELRKVFK